jgi:hypothetical protein
LLQLPLGSLSGGTPKTGPDQFELVALGSLLAGGFLRRLLRRCLGSHVHLLTWCPAATGSASDYYFICILSLADTPTCVKAPIV